MLPLQFESNTDDKSLTVQLPPLETTIQNQNEKTHEMMHAVQITLEEDIKRTDENTKLINKSIKPYKIKRKVKILKVRITASKIGIKVLWSVGIATVPLVGIGGIFIMAAECIRGIHLKSLYKDLWVLENFPESTEQ